jgi:Kef-type K+ transport system membrane component KefB
MTETWRASWRAGVAMSTTSVAAVYALMLEFGLNVTSYGTLLMATGLIFGTNSALPALSHGVITRAQYSALVAAVVASAVVPTLIANACFLPRHLLRPRVASEPAASTTSSAAAARGGS